jgi:predicted N-acetyltransferase YhbS
VTLSFSTASESDLDDVIQIHACAYPDSRSYDERRRGLTSNALGDLHDLIVAKNSSGEVVGHACLYSLTMQAWSQAIRIGGIASVGVAPEARSQGVARALMNHLHGLSRQRNQAGTLLYAFRDEFYERLGYAPMAPSMTLEFAPASVPRTGLVLDGDATVQPARRAVAADYEELTAVYAREAARRVGFLERSPRRWEMRFLNERLHTFVFATGPNQRLEGYAVLRYEQAEAHAQTTLVVQEWLSETPEARHAFFAFLRAQRGQVTHVRLTCSMDDPMLLALSDPDRKRHGTAALEHPYGTLAAGPMFRAHSVMALLAMIPLRETAEKKRILRLGLGAANGLTSVSPRMNSVPSTTLEVSDEGVGFTDRPASVRLQDENVLCRMLLGGLTPKEAQALGLAEGSAEAIRALELALHPERMFSFDPF